MADSDSLSSTFRQHVKHQSSQALNPLSLSLLWGTNPAMSRRSEHVRLRLREEMTRRDMSQRDVAGILNWSQSKVAHILNGRVELSVDDLEAFCFGVGISITEAVRDRGLEFCAEMTPTEMRLLELWRAMGQADRDAHWHMMTAHTKAVLPEQRRAAPSRIVKKRIDGRA